MLLLLLSYYITLVYIRLCYIIQLLYHIIQELYYIIQVLYYIQ